MSYLPVPNQPGCSPLPVPHEPGRSLSRSQTKRASRAQAKTELVVFRQALQARAQSEMDQNDSNSTLDAMRVALDCELELLDYGMSRAGQSAAKVELVARHVERLSVINSRRLTRRFGA